VIPGNSVSRGHQDLATMAFIHPGGRLPLTKLMMNMLIAQNPSLVPSQPSAPTRNIGL
jgi:hypothetical protein